jgi:hypothetical protein
MLRFGLWLVTAIVVASFAVALLGGLLETALLR